MADRFAPTTRRTRASRMRTLTTLVRDAGAELLPVTAAAMYTVAAALKAGRYRTGRAYLGLWETLHREAGLAWTEDLAQAKAWSRKSIERGLGPARSAATVDFAAWAAAAPPGADTDCIIIGCLWMLRGAELAGLLVEQARTGPGARIGTLNLGAHKTNPEGMLCERALRCTCGRGAAVWRGAGVHGGPAGDALCPAHALWRAVQRRRDAQQPGLDEGKAPLFGTAAGRARSSSEMRKHLRTTLQCSRVSEHSLRRMGAQFYARHGVGLALVQHIGRWGSSAVERYVGEALATRSAWAPVAAARGIDAAAMLGAASQNILDINVLRTLVRECAQAGPNQPQLAPALATPPLDYVVAGRSGVCHLVRIAGPDLPIEEWEAACGWRFGSRPHTRGAAGDISCSRCAAVFMGRSRASGVEVPV